MIKLPDKKWVRGFWIGEKDPGRVAITFGILSSEDNPTREYTLPTSLFLRCYRILVFADAQHSTKINYKNKYNFFIFYFKKKTDLGGKRKKMLNLSYLRLRYSLG
jgi:hypothetical protein